MGAEDGSIRLANFQRAWSKYGWSATLLKQRCGGGVSFWSDLYNGKKPSFGEKLARKIETGMELVRLSLDDPDGAKPLPLAGDVLDALGALDDDARHRMNDVIRAMLGLSGKQSGESK